jgi:hypothetical protein
MMIFKYTNFSFLPLSLFLCLVGSQVHGQTKTGAAIIVSIEGALTVTKGENREPVPKEEVAVGKSIYQGYHLEGTKGSKVVLLMSSGTLITLVDEFKFTIEKFEQEEFKGSGETLEEITEEPSKSEAKLKLAQGELHFNVKKLKPGSSFEIESPIGSAGIRGTAGVIMAILDPNTGTFQGSVSMLNGIVTFTSPSGVSVNLPAGQAAQVTATRDGQQVGATQRNAVPAETTEKMNEVNNDANQLASEVTVESLVDIIIQVSEQFKQDSAPAPAEGNNNDGANNDQPANDQDAGIKNDDGAAISPQKAAILDTLTAIAEGVSEGAVFVAAGLSQEPQSLVNVINGLTSAVVQEGVAAATKQGVDPSLAVQSLTQGVVSGAVAAAVQTNLPTEVVQQLGEAAKQAAASTASQMDNVSQDAVTEVNVGDAITQAESNADQSVDFDAANDALAQNSGNYQNFFIVDSDNDGLGDATEEAIGSDPHNPDTDGDLLMDGYEYLLHGANPLLADTDGDLISDSLEIHMGSDPLTVDSFGLDSDIDGIPDSYEALLGTHPEDVDSDDDGWTDGFEVGVGSNPLVHDTFIPETGFTVSPIAPGDPFPWLIREGLNPGPWWLRHLW